MKKIVDKGYARAKEVLTSKIEDLHKLTKALIIYETLSGWEETTRGVTKFVDLPLNAQNFIMKIEILVGCKVDIISTGPERDECIIINEVFN